MYVLDDGAQDHSCRHRFHPLRTMEINVKTIFLHIQLILKIPKPEIAEASKTVK